MFSIEFVSGRPSTSASYYAVVIREPYTIGCVSHCDIVLNQPDIAARHATLSVMRLGNVQAQAEGQSRSDTNVLMMEGSCTDQTSSDGYSSAGDNPVEQRGAASLGHIVDGTFLNDTNDNNEGAEALSVGSGGSTLYCKPGNVKTNLNTKVVRELDPLVVVVRRLPGAGRVAVDDVEVTEAQPRTIMDGGQLSLGDRVRLRFRFRPLIVTVSRSGFSAKQAHELECAFHQRGATVEPGFSPTRELDVPLPVGLLHCTPVLGHDDPSCIAALACDYTVVDHEYIPKWFAALARNAASPLSALPPPAHSNVAIWCGDSCSHNWEYLRPECDSSPFPLYVIASPVRLSRSRSTLFAGRVFFFLTSAVESRYRAAVVTCGGTLQQLEEVVLAVGMFCDGVEEERRQGDQHRNGRPEATTPTGAHYYAVLDRETELAWQNGDSPAQTALRKLRDDAQRVGCRMTFIAERGLFQSLVQNRFTAVEVHLPSFTEVCRDDHWDARGTVTPSGRLSPTSGAPTTPVRGLSPKSTSRSWNRGGLLEVLQKNCFGDGSATPKRPRKDLSATGRPVVSSRGGVHPSCVVSNCEVLHQRVQGLLRKDLPRLLEIEAALRRHMFVSPGVSAYVSECQAKCLRYISKADDLLSHKLRDTSLHQSLVNCKGCSRKVLGVVKAIVSTIPTESRGKGEGRDRSMSSTSGVNHSQTAGGSSSSRAFVLDPVLSLGALSVKTGGGGASQRRTLSRSVDTTLKSASPTSGVRVTRRPVKGSTTTRRTQRAGGHAGSAEGPGSTSAEPRSLDMAVPSSAACSPAPRRPALPLPASVAHAFDFGGRNPPTSSGALLTAFRSRAGVASIVGVPTDSRPHQVEKPPLRVAWPRAPRTVPSPRVSGVVHRSRKAR